MISAWDIYWVMQLDSIGGWLFTIFLLGLVIGGMAMAFQMCAAAYQDEDDEAKRWANILRPSKAVVAVALICGFVNALLPSTKTAAMMVVIPRVANNEAIQKEAGDLYGIAKDALKRLAEPKDGDK